MTADTLTVEGLRRRRTEILDVARKGRGSVSRRVDDLLADLTEAADAAAELVSLGKKRLRLHRIDYEEVWVTLRDDVP